MTLGKSDSSLLVCNLMAKTELVMAIFNSKLQMDTN